VVSLITPSADIGRRNQLLTHCSEDLAQVCRWPSPPSSKITAFARLALAAKIASVSDRRSDGKAVRVFISPMHNIICNEYDQRPRGRRLF